MKPELIQITQITDDVIQVWAMSAERTIFKAKYKLFSKVDHQQAKNYALHEKKTD